MTKKTITSERSGVLVCDAIEAVMQATRMFAHQLWDAKTELSHPEVYNYDISKLERIIHENERLIEESISFLKNAIREGKNFNEPV